MPVWGLYIFLHYLIIGTTFGKIFTKRKMWFDFLYNVTWNFFILRRRQRDITINVQGSSCKVPVILVRFKSNLKIHGIFSKNFQISNLMKILPVGAELFHANGQTSGQIDMTKLIVAFLQFANSPKKVAGNIKCTWSTQNFIKTRWVI